MTNKTLKVVVLSLALLCGAFAQNVPVVGNQVDQGATLPATCNVGQIYFLTSGSTGLYACKTLNAWTLTGGGSFSTITSGTNANNLLVSGTLAPTGAGSITATAVVNIVQSGLLASYDFHEGSGTVVHDVSGLNSCGGSSCDANFQGGGSNLPTWVTGGLQWNSTSDTGVQFPSQLNSAQTIVISAYLNNFTTTGQYIETLMGHSLDNGGIELELTQGACTYNVNPTQIFGNEFLTTLLKTTGGGHTNECGGGIGAMQGKNAVILWNPLTATMNINTWGQYPGNVSIGALSAPASGGYLLGNNILMISGSDWCRGNNAGAACTFVGTVYRVDFYSTVLTAAQLTQEALSHQYLMNVKGVNTNAYTIPSDTANKFTVTGDSIAATDDSHNFVQYIAPTDTYSIYSFSIGGVYEVNIAPTVQNYHASLISNNSPLSVLVFEAGTNDICSGGYTPQQVFDAYKKSVFAARQAGWKKILGQTMLSRNDGCTEANLQTFSNLLRNGWSAIGLDGLIDVGADPNLGATGAAANAAYFPDGVHPRTTLAAQLIASYYNAAINGLDFGNNKGYPTVVTGATYTMTTADRLVFADTTSNNITITLPTCLGITGMTFPIISKQGTAGHLLTLTGASSQNINGSNSFSVNNGTAITLQAFVTSSSAGGCYWQAVGTSNPITASNSVVLSEAAAPSGISTLDIVYADSTLHRLKGIANNGIASAYAQFTDNLSVFATGGAIAPATVNGLTISTSTGTLTVTNGKTLSVSNSLTLAGTDSTTMTFPSTSATIARTDAGQTFTGVDVFANPTINGATSSGSTAINLSGNSGTYSSPTGANTFGGSSNLFTTAALNLTEIAAPSGVASSDLIWGDSTAHRLKVNDNNGGSTTLALFTDNLSVFASGGTISPTTLSTTNGVALTNLAQIATNTVLGNSTSGTANVVALAVGGCSAATNALIWTTNTGFGCNSSINAATLGGATFASPGAIGGTTAGTGSFTTGTFSGLVNVNTSQPVTRTVCANVTPVTVNANTASDQLLMSCTIPAGQLNNVLRALEFDVYGIYSTAASSTAQLTYKAKLCTVSGCGSGTVINLLSIQTVALATITVTNNAVHLHGHALTQTAGASAAFESHGRMDVDLGALTTAADSVFNDTNTATIGTIDSTAQLFLQITGAFSSASASNSWSQRSFLVKISN